MRYTQETALIFQQLQWTAKDWVMQSVCRSDLVTLINRMERASLSVVHSSAVRGGAELMQVWLRSGDLVLRCSELVGWRSHSLLCLNRADICFPYSHRDFHWCSWDGFVFGHRSISLLSLLVLLVWLYQHDLLTLNLSFYVHLWHWLCFTEKLCAPSIIYNSSPLFQVVRSFVTVYFGGCMVSNVQLWWSWLNIYPGIEEQRALVGRVCFEQESLLCWLLHDRWLKMCRCKSIGNVFCKKLNLSKGWVGSGDGALTPSLTGFGFSSGTISIFQKAGETGQIDTCTGRVWNRGDRG